ncbi:hypothetical protein C5L14_19110 [Labrys okinawensis]|uniref:Glycosyl transferase family 1 domain-containing protein n=1 Tax=Labrys okinawensis TaxID=346911 RepID=A0A2S9QAG7_9HYPH|nr:glycosyltransferase [Labrys okinawensis]PRH86339.1 hypothetical protein C5L14_19110 [Labrys okinawensis]
MGKFYSRAQEMEFSTEASMGSNSSLNTKPTIWLDISDFSQYAEAGNITVSGIQRVIANLVTHAGLSAFDVRPVILDRDAKAVRAADAALVGELVTLLQSGAAKRDNVVALEERVRASRVKVEVLPGDVYVMAGAFWIYQHYDLFSELRAKGVKIALFVHDLIQIRYPEYLSADANVQFRKSFLDVLAMVSLILANSEHVRSEVLEFVRSRLNLEIPVQAITLPTELPAIAKDATIDDRVIEVAKREFVLCVSTLEIRKNHVYLLKIWQKLFRERGLLVPNLVFVGKWGWMFEELRDHVEASNGIDRWLFIFNELSDAGLSYLYDRCLLTAYPSFAEGWGLPVGESLAHGKPCLASGVTSIPEVGGRFVRYFDPHNVEEGFQLFRDTLSDRHGIAEWAASIKRELKLKTWNEYCEEFYAAIDAHTMDPVTPNPLGNHVYLANRLYYLGNDDVARMDSKGELLLTARMTRVRGWHAIEHWGCWASDRCAVLRLQTELREGEEVIIAMRVVAPEGDNCPSLSTEVGGIVTDHGPVSRNEVFVRFDGRVSKDGMLEILVKSGGVPNGPLHGRILYVGFTSVGFSLKRDIEGRVALLEQITETESRTRRQEIHTSSSPGHSSSVHDGLSPSAFISSLLLNKGGGNSPKESVFRRLWFRTVLISAQRAARRHDWRTAEKRYARLLRYRLDQPRLIVQYGHALKEQGAFPAAAGAYQFALSLDPANEETRRLWEFASERARH